MKSNVSDKIKDIYEINRDELVLLLNKNFFSKQEIRDKINNILKFEISFLLRKFGFNENPLYAYILQDKIKEFRKNISEREEIILSINTIDTLSEILGKFNITEGFFHIN